MTVEAIAYGHIIKKNHEPSRIAGLSAELKFKLSDYGVRAWTDATIILGNEIRINLKTVAGNGGETCYSGIAFG
jgi:hypothetical protein|tara:strand:+ start:149 stop:370 length:222 start_codon:yes stop_codon:yes gene_type:complete